MITRRLRWARPLATLLSIAMILQSAPAVYAAPGEGAAPDDPVTVEETTDGSTAEAVTDQEISSTTGEVSEDPIDEAETAAVEGSTLEETADEITEEETKDVSLPGDPEPVGDAAVIRSTMDLATKVRPAILEDRIADQSKKIDPVIENYSVTAVAAGSDIKVTVSGNNLMRHANANGMEGYWLGIAMPKEELPEGITVKFYCGWEAPTDESVYEAYDGGEDADNYTFYYGTLNKSKPIKTLYVSARYYDGTEPKQTVTYIVDSTRVTLKEAYPSIDEVGAVTEALPVDADDVTRRIYSSYSLGNVTKTDGNVINVPVNAADLLKHTAGAAAGEGYWVGIGIPDLTGAGFTAKYKQSYTEIEDISAETPGWNDVLDDTLVKDGKAYKTVYFNAADSRLADNVGYVYVKYTATRSDTDVKIYTFKVDMSGVTKAMALGANDLIAANLDDRASANAMTPAQLYREGTYKVTTTSGYDAVLAKEQPEIIPVKIEAEDLMPHAAGNGMVAYWTGVGIPKALEIAAPDVKYYAGFELPTADMVDKAVGLVKDDEQIVDGVTYDTFYFGADKLAGTNKKAYLAVKFTDGELVSTVIYELDFSKVKVKKTDYTVEISETETEIGKILETGTTGTSTVKAVVVKGSDPVANVPVVWKSSDTDIAAVAPVSTANTDSSGSVTANITLKTVSAPCKVEITATAAGRNVGTYTIEFYEKLAVTGEDNLHMVLPGETECALTPSYTLPAGSAYMSKWVSSAPSVATIDEFGIVNAVSDGVAEFDQCIVDALTGEPVDKFGKATSDEAKKLKSAADTYKVTVSTVLAGISIAEPSVSIYANGQTVDDALKLILNPESFDKTKLTSVTWRSARATVATVEADAGDPTKASVTGLLSGSNTIYVEVVADGITYKTSKVVKIKPVVESIGIGRKGDETPAAQSGNTYEVAKGSSVILYAEIGNSGGADTTVSWSVDDQSVARVDDKGVVTALKKGTAVITASVPDGSYATAQINVVETLTSLTTDIKNININGGEEVAVEAVLSSSIASYDLEWFTSEDEKEDEDKLITISFEGTKAIITANTGDKKGTAKVTVRDKVTGLKSVVNVTVAGKSVPITALTTNSNTYTLFIGNSTALSYTAVPANFSDAALVWTSSAPDKVSVSDTGVVTALALTDTPVFVTVQAMKITGVDPSTYKNTYEEILDKNYEPIRVRFRVEVKTTPDVASVTVEPRTVTGLKTGESVKLKAKAFPEYAGTGFIWASSDEDVAIVDAAGTVKAIAPGTAEITVTSDGINAKAVITVAESVDNRDMLTGRFRTEELWIGAIDDYDYTGSAITPVPNVYYGSTLLTNGVDYTLSYKNNINAARVKNKPAVTVKAKGNYSGTVTAEFVIHKAQLTDAGIVVNKASSAAKVLASGGYKEQLLKPVITFNGKTLKAGTDYELYYVDEAEGAYEAPGEWNIGVYGTGNFEGEINIPEILVDPESAVSIAKATIVGIDAQYYYTGDAIVPEEPEVFVGTKLTEGEDYEITYINNVKLGTATATVTGIGQYYGSKKKTFKIVPQVVNLARAEDGDLEVTLDKDATGAEQHVSFSLGVPDYADPDDPGDKPVIGYSKSGTKPGTLTVTYCGTELGSGDYTWTNKADVKKGIGTVTIKAKGKFYKGSVTFQYEIGKTDLSDYTFVTDDFVYSPKANAYKKNKLTVYDRAGKTLKAGTDYDAVFEAENSIPGIGSYVTVTVTGKGFYEGDATLSFRVIDKNQKLSAATYSFMEDGEEIKASKYSVKYDGSPIVLEQDNIVLKVKRKVGRTYHWVTLDDSDYEIVAYMNNNKVGTSSIVLKGTGDYGGLMTIKFKIKK